MQEKLSAEVEHLRSDKKHLHQKLEVLGTENKILLERNQILELENNKLQTKFDMLDNENRKILKINDKILKNNAKDRKAIVGLGTRNSYLVEENLELKILNRDLECEVELCRNECSVMKELPSSDE